MGLVGGLIKFIIASVLALVIIVLVGVALLYIWRLKNEKNDDVESNQFQLPPQAAQQWIFDPLQQQQQLYNFEHQKTYQG